MLDYRNYLDIKILADELKEAFEISEQKCNHMKVLKLVIVL